MSVLESERVDLWLSFAGLTGFCVFFLDDEDILVPRGTVLMSIVACLGQRTHFIFKILLKVIYYLVTKESCSMYVHTKAGTWLDGILLHHV